MFVLLWHQIVREDNYLTLISSLRVAAPRFHSVLSERPLSLRSIAKRKSQQ
jgi:hypothetical protein